MEYFYKRWDAEQRAFGDAAVVAFLVVQCLDGALTYLGVRWGLGIEANPLVATAVQAIGLGAGLAVMKLLAAGFGMLLHLHRVHAMVALLTVIYVGAAILPWTAIFLLATSH